MKNNKTANAFRDDLMKDYDATKLAELVQKKEISAYELVETAIERIKSVNPTINAVSSNCYDKALEQSKKVSGDFGGIPIFLKDQINMAGLPTLHGSTAVPKKNHKKNDKSVDQILSTGVVVLGKSTSSELGILPCGETLLDGATRNPLNIAYSTGGSSAGSGALVASGAIPISHAMDGGGSIRIPAACCGLVGLKPTRQRHIDSFTKIFPVDFAEQGIVSRTVRDTANYFAAIEKYHQNPKLPTIGKVEGPAKKRLRIGMYTETLPGTRCDSDIAQATEKAARSCADLGHHVEEVKNPFGMEFKMDFTTYYSFVAQAGKTFGYVPFGLKYKPRKLENFTKLFANMFPAFLAASPRAFQRLKNFDHQYMSAFQNYDVLLCPTISIPVPKIGFWDPKEDPKILLDRLSSYIHSTMVQNIAGAPAMSLPLDTCSQGLPIGIQFAAKQGEEKMLLELAFELEAAGHFAPFLNEKIANQQEVLS